MVEAVRRLFSPFGGPLKDIPSIELGDEFFAIIQRIQSETGIKRTEFSADRLILRQVSEVVGCLQEQIASAEEIDRAMVLGTGFPA